MRNVTRSRLLGLSLLLVTVVSCATAPPGNAGRPHHVFASAPSPQSRIDTNQLQVHKGTPPAPDSDAIAIITTDGTNLLQQNPDGTTSTLGGGGGGTVTADAPLTGNGSSGSHLGVRAATTSLSGYLAATDKTKLDSLASGGWFDAEALAVSALVPQLTEFVPFKLGQFLFGGALTAGNTNLAAALEGGGLRTANTTFTLVGTSITQNAKTSRWSFSARAKLTPPDGTHLNTWIGLINAAGSHAIYVGSENSADATHFVLRFLNASSTTVVGSVADSSVHDWRITFDLTTVNVYKDGVLDMTTSTLTNMAAEPVFPFIYNTVNADVQASKILVGVVAQ